MADRQRTVMLYCNSLHKGGAERVFAQLAGRFADCGWRSILVTSFADPGREEYPLPPPTLELTGITLEGLIAAFARVMARTEEKEDRPEAAARRIIRDEYTVPRCTAHILRRLKKGPVRFEELFSKDPTRDEVVTLFLALLELLRLGRAAVKQEGIFGEMRVEAREIDSDTEGTMEIDGYA